MADSKRFLENDIYSNTSLVGRGATGPRVRANMITACR
jgi:hypothetical protein